MSDHDAAISNPVEENRQTWFVYMVRCVDETLYTGITTNIERRLSEHNDTSINSKAARYTRTRQPVVLVYAEQVTDRSEASRREAELKALPRAQKLLQAIESLD